MRASKIPHKNCLSLILLPKVVILNISLILGDTDETSKSK